MKAKTRLHNSAILLPVPHEDPTAGQAIILHAGIRAVGHSPALPQARRAAQICTSTASTSGHSVTVPGNKDRTGHKLQPSAAKTGSNSIGPNGFSASLRLQRPRCRIGQLTDILHAAKKQRPHAFLRRAFMKSRCLFACTRRLRQAPASGVYRTSAAGAPASDMGWSRLPGFMPALSRSALL